MSTTEQHGGHHRPNTEPSAEIIVEEMIIEKNGEVLDEIIDIEIYAKEKKDPPHAKGYKIRIDKEYKVVHVPHLTGRQILGLVDKTPEKYLLSQKHRDGKITPVAADQVVDFRRHGVERFQTLALDPTEG